MKNKNPSKIYLECTEDNHSKFYFIIVEKHRVIKQFGRIGQHGQIQEKTFPTHKKAKSYFEYQVSHRISKKGYLMATLPLYLYMNAKIFTQLKISYEDLL